ncbi:MULTISPECIES: peptidylprolyl isomerase [unclassified Pseudoalteromonas]|uniref:peptidylprolyl isomerase n=1 Tax=unclassified Pseudoalteromonas TaxID=194690 RepID=UPI0025B49782|nr:MULTISPECIES: peptidylprolyl isomerase [unclassified Pseudoalteromonas]MDN3380369.1 peptidylprolyl isomerase [Pseudoalteromonas sp. APC 3893]MDN3388702.1 peptidylprolyl isomerase [Pseudoalteromonas sp. APC 4017]
MKKLLLSSVLAALSFSTHASVVEMHTSQGTITINLFDQHTPKTVENFLSYVVNDAYNETVIHRSVDDFVIQGGGFTFTDDFEAIETQSAVTNEPVLSNVKGTIAMAKLGSNENSATSQWFFNLKDNSANLDVQNGGFTVFGQITEDSYEVLNAIAGLVHCETKFGTTPVVNITTEQCADAETVITVANLVPINSAVVVDDDPNSSVNLSPTENTLIDEDTTSEPIDIDSSGSVGWFALPLILLGLKRRGKL